MKETNPTAKMAEEYIRKNSILSNGEINANKTRFFALRDVLADFADYYHKQEMNKAQRYTFEMGGGQLCGYGLIRMDDKGDFVKYSDLTKNDEG